MVFDLRSSRSSMNKEVNILAVDDDDLAVGLLVAARKKHTSVMNRSSTCSSGSSSNEGSYLVGSLSRRSFSRFKSSSSLSGTQFVPATAAAPGIASIPKRDDHSSSTASKSRASNSQPTTSSLQTSSDILIDLLDSESAAVEYRKTAFQIVGGTTTSPRTLLPVDSNPEHQRCPPPKHVHFSSQPPSVYQYISMSEKLSFRKRISNRFKKDGDGAPKSPRRSKSVSGDEIVTSTEPPDSPPRLSPSRSHSMSDAPDESDHNDSSSSTAEDNSTSSPTSGASRGRSGGGGNVFSRIRERSRSRSRSRRRNENGTAADHKEMLVAVTSCRSDGYYNQKAPGSITKLPRKAPTNLKLFHELAVGVKDAYAAVNATPRKPTDEKAPTYVAEMSLWEFVSNLDFVSRRSDETTTQRKCHFLTNFFLQLLALVDEVAVDNVTRGALKDDATFKGLRDVIKKGNRVLEEMLVRRERKYTLFFRLAQAHDQEQLSRISAWNTKVEKAVKQVTGPRELPGDSDASTDLTNASGMSPGSVSSRAGVFSRGRQLLPTAGKVRSRRATPTPRLRKVRGKGDDSSAGGAAEDGFSVVSAPDPLAKRSKSGDDDDDDRVGGMPNGLAFRGSGSFKPEERSPVVEPKDELVDVIRGLRVEKIRSKENSADEELAALKPSWRPKAEVPASVPKLPIEYVHRHRLMKQVVSCLLDEADAPVGDDGNPLNTAITCVTSRHGDKAGNGKSTLAVAVIQTVEVRERFPDGIAWLKLGRGPLSERDIRRLYEDLYRQLVVKEEDIEASVSEADTDPSNFHESMSSIRTDLSEARNERLVDRSDSTQRFQGGDLEGIKEDLARMIVRRKVLICLDDVWTVEDAKWFIFELPSYSMPQRNSPFKLLITTRTPSLLGQNTVQEVYVRILSEHEAVKLLLSTAGRRPYGGRASNVFMQSKLVVKGCGNSPLGILLVGSMLRQYNRNWNLSSPAWQGIYNQCGMNLEEAAQLRSFRNALTRIVDLSFFTIQDVDLRIELRRCFVLFAAAFKQNDWMLSGRGIPECVIMEFFDNIIAAGPGRDKDIESETILMLLENLRLIQRARNVVSAARTKLSSDNASVSSNGGTEGSAKSDSEWDDFDEPPKRPIQHFYTMHDSLKAVAETMRERPLPAFTPIDDNYTYYSDLIEGERKALSVDSGADWQAPFRFLTQHLASNGDKNKEEYLSDEQVNELIATTLLSAGGEKAMAKQSITDAMRAGQVAVKSLEGGDKLEEYTMAFMTKHLMASHSYTNATALLVDEEFVRRRVFALGVMQATERQVSDVADLRAYYASKNVKGPGSEEEDTSDNSEVDIDNAVCTACRIIVDEVYKVTNNMGPSDSLGMATCLATVGETLLKCRQPRDAMLRLEEAVTIFRGLLGPYHVYVAHTLQLVAKALTKLGETRVALLKFAEAARIYETCNATLYYESISNAQALASLLVDIGDVRKAESMFEEVISMKQAVYGDNAVPVARTINNYAILLAKHGRLEDALRNYGIARATYLRRPPPTILDPEFEIKCSYDITLITLNIASIYSKKGEQQSALECYEEGVRGLEEFEDAMEKIRENNPASHERVAKTSSHKHIVAALGRIGSLKLKMGDEEGALEAYLALIDQVNDDSPIASHTEKAKAHIKVATIFRSRGDEEEEKEQALAHLREALRMYKALYGAKHKDTVAIATSLKQWLSEDSK